MSVQSCFLLGVLSIVGVFLVGCGEEATNELWDGALSLDSSWRERLDPAVADGSVSQQRAHQTKAEALELTLRMHRDASEGGLRGVLETIKDGERQLANGEVSGEEADALREKHEQYWSHLREGQLPPDYQ
ncbi:MAG: hypothetical protein WD294_14715 [Phycisphaeraceae bacterium]